MDLAGYLAILRRRAWAIVLCLVAGLIGGYYSGHHPDKQYEATSRTFVNLPLSQGSTVQEALAGTELSAKIITTYATIATSRRVAERVVQTLGLDESPGAVRGKLSASVQKDT